MASCPSCRRPVALVRATCFYCGASLPPEDVPSTAGAPTAPAGEAGARTAADGTRGAPPAGRTLLVLDLAGLSTAVLARALDRPLYEADLVARRGGLHLHRVLAAASAEAEAERLASRGIASYLVPEEEARVRPVRALGGEGGEGSLALRTEEGPVELRRGDVLLVVRGTITREYQPCPETGEFFCVVTDVYEVMEAEQTAFSLAYSGRSWSRIQRVLRARQSAEPAMRMLGQCHGLISSPTTAKPVKPVRPGQSAP